MHEVLCLKSKIAFEYENDGGVLQAGDFARRVDVLDDKLVSFANICKNACVSLKSLLGYISRVVVGTPFVRRASAPRHCQ
tara:strand:- start:2770 stop:3009 length:240 start_codon:yes stop_codon:yes gene_type:complete